MLATLDLITTIFSAELKLVIAIISTLAFLCPLSSIGSLCPVVLRLLVEEEKLMLSLCYYGEQPLPMASIDNFA